MKLIPKFKIGSKIRKAKLGLDIDELGIPGAEFSAQYKPRKAEYIDESLDDGVYLEKPTLPKTQSKKKKVKTEADWLAQANRFTGGAFKTLNDVKKWLSDNGLDSDGQFGAKSMNKWLELLRKPEIKSTDSIDPELLKDIRSSYKDDVLDVIVPGVDQTASGFIIQTPKSDFKFVEGPVNHKYYEGKGWYYNGKYYELKSNDGKGKIYYKNSNRGIIPKSVKETNFAEYTSGDSPIAGTWSGGDVSRFKDPKFTIFSPRMTFTGQDGKTYRVTSVNTKTVPKTNFDRKIIYKLK